MLISCPGGGEEREREREADRERREKKREEREEEKEKNTMEVHIRGFMAGQKSRAQKKSSESLQKKVIERISFVLTHEMSFEMNS